MPVAIRLAEPEDAASLLSLQHRLDSQSRYMLLEPGERTQAPDHLRDRLAGQSGSLELVAEEDGGVLGWLSVEVLPFRRARHTGYIVVGVDADAAGRGIGGSLLAKAGEEAVRRGLLR